MWAGMSRSVNNQNTAGQHLNNDVGNVYDVHYDENGVGNVNNNAHGENYRFPGL